jgi:hypothetical protein
MQDVAMIVVPHYKEFAVKKIWPLLSTNRSLQEYLPDYPKAAIPNRTYLYNVRLDLQGDPNLI